MKKSDYLKIGGLTAAITAASALNVAGQSQDGLTRKIDNLKKQKQFYTLINEESSKDAATYILKDLVEKNLEANTGGQFIPAADSAVYLNDKGEFRSRIMQASELTADHPNADKYKWLATTITDFSTEADMNNAETKQLVIDNYTAKEDQIGILHNKDGNRVEVYIKNADGKTLPLSKHIHKNNALSTNSHLLYLKNKELDVDTKIVGRAMGFMPTVVGHYEGVIDSLDNEITTLTDSIDTINGDLAFAQGQISDLNDEIDKKNEAIGTLNEIVSLWKAGVTGYVPVGNGKITKDDISFELYSTLPIGNHGVKIAFGYALVKDKFSKTDYKEVPQSRYLDESPSPLFDDSFGYEEAMTTHNVSNNHKIYGALGIGIGKDWFINAKGGLNIKDEENTKNVNSITGFVTGEGDTYDVNTTKLDPEQTISNIKQAYAGLGLEKFLGPLVLEANAIYNFDKNKPKFSDNISGEVGVGLDLVALYNIFK